MSRLCVQPVTFCDCGATGFDPDETRCWKCGGRMEVSDGAA